MASPAVPTTRGKTVAIDEPTRYQLHQRLDEVLGREEAAALMACLPPLGWGDVASKADLALLRAQLHGDLADLRADMREEITTQTRTLLVGFLGANAAFAALAFAAARLA